MKILLLVIAGMFASATTIFAEDWTTTDGKKYISVTVIKVEADSVTILDSDGGARVPLATLPPDLQKKFNYDPQKAADAAKARDQELIASQQALHAEARKAQQLKKDEAANAQSPTPPETKPLADQISDLQTQIAALNSDIDEKNKIHSKNTSPSAGAGYRDIIDQEVAQVSQLTAQLNVLINQQNNEISAAAKAKVEAQNASNAPTQSPPPNP
jgi:hypothetical protein